MYWVCPPQKAATDRKTLLWNLLHMYTDQRLLGFLVLKKATDRQTFLWGLVCMRTNVCGREPILMKPTETFNSNQDSRSGDSEGTIYPQYIHTQLQFQSAKLCNQTAQTYWLPKFQIHLVGDTHISDLYFSAYVILQIRTENNDCHRVGVFKPHSLRSRCQ